MGRRRDARGAAGAALTVSQAATLWHVSRAAVYKWMRQGILSCFTDAPEGGEAIALRADILSARVLRTQELRSFGISREALAVARRAGVVKPDVLQRVARFSLEDVAAVRDFGWPSPASRPREPARQLAQALPECLVMRTVREREWVANGADPAKLPDEDFDSPAPLSVRTPPGIFLYERGERVPGSTNARYVRRSGGWDYVDGTLRWFEADDQFAVLPAGQRLPPDWEESNLYYRVATREWNREWGRRQDRRRRPKHP